MECCISMYDGERYHTDDITTKVRLLGYNGRLEGGGGEWVLGVCMWNQMVLSLNAYQAFWKDSEIRVLHKEVGKERRTKKGKTVRKRKKE